MNLIHACNRIMESAESQIYKYFWTRNWSPNAANLLLVVVVVVVVVVRG